MVAISKPSGVREKLPSRQYGLVCGLQFERFHSREMALIPGVANPLFRLFPDSQIAWAGPWLIDIEKGHELYSLLSSLEQHAPAVSWIRSTVDFEKLTQSLASQLHVALESGEQGLLRFYDPRVLRKIPEILTAEQFSDFTRGIDSWLFDMDGKRYDVIRMER